MANELNFPPSADAAANQLPVANEVGPDTSPYYTNNGLTYLYNADKDSWILRTGDAVTVAYLETELLTKLDKTGGTIVGDSIGGKLNFSLSPAETDPDVIELNTKGQFIMRESKKEIIFEDASDPAYIFVNNNDSSNRVIGFDNAKVAFFKPLVFSNLIGDDKSLISHAKSPTDDLVVIDLHTAGTYSGGNVIAFAPSSSLKIKSGLESVCTYTTSGVEVNVASSGKRTLMVKRPSDNTEVFRVDSDNGKIYATLLYDQGLQAGENGIANPETNDVQVYNPAEEPHLLATVGYVSQGLFRPGMNVFAESEAETEVGGMWRSGGNFYIRVE